MPFSYLVIMKNTSAFLKEPFNVVYVTFASIKSKQLSKD